MEENIQSPSPESAERPAFHVAAQYTKQTNAAVQQNLIQ
jgi:hypothetical protein